MKKTALFFAEILFNETIRHYGGLAPKYFFVDVVINGNNIGIMAVEEHFSKELLELNGDAFNILNECSGIKNFDLISYRVEYRGTNKFGALVKTDTNVLTYNNEVYTDIYNIDKAFKEDTKKLTE